MKATRREATMAAAEVASRRGKFGLILGTLGRQGNPRILDRLKDMCETPLLPPLLLPSLPSPQQTKVALMPGCVCVCVCVCRCTSTPYIVPVVSARTYTRMHAG